MSPRIASIFAEADPLRFEAQGLGEELRGAFAAPRGKIPTDHEPQLESMPAHSFGASSPRINHARPPVAASAMRDEDACAGEIERQMYRDRSAAMLRRYVRYAMETGRLPSLLGREFFRAKVTSYTIVTFEDRVIFVHDMETCLDRLDEFSRQLIARHILQEHDRWATARFLQCNEKTVRRLTPLALDQLSEILLDRGLLERIETLDASRNTSCQEGGKRKAAATDWEKYR